MLSPVGIDAAQHRIEGLTSRVLAVEVIQVASVILDLGWLLPRLLFELVDDLPTTLVERNQSDYTCHRRGWYRDRDHRRGVPVVHAGHRGVDGLRDPFDPVVTPMHT